MVTIRLSRGGAKKRPFYHVVVTDSRSRRDGRFIERLGYFNPVATGNETRLNMEKDRLAHWVGQGAQVSDRVKGLLHELENGRKAKKPKKTTASAPEAKTEEANAAPAAEEAPKADNE